VQLKKTQPQKDTQEGKKWKEYRRKKNKQKATAEDKGSQGEGTRARIPAALQNVSSEKRLATRRDSDPRQDFSAEKKEGTGQNMLLNGMLTLQAEK